MRIGRDLNPRSPVKGSLVFKTSAFSRSATYPKPNQHSVKANEFCLIKNPKRLIRLAEVVGFEPTLHGSKDRRDCHYTIPQYVKCAHMKIYHTSNLEAKLKKVFKFCALGCQESNLELRSQSPSCCQLHHIPIFC